MKWIENYTVDPHDIDYHGVAKASSLMRYMQQTANAQCYHLGPSLEALRAEQGLAFLLSRFSSAFYKTVYAYDKLRVETWGVESRGFSFNRCYRILRDNEIIAEATSVWALVNIETHSPVRVSEYHPNFDYEEMITPDAPSRVVFPSAVPLVSCGTHCVTYGETDQNMHLNNTYYPDMLMNTISFKDLRISRMTFNFMNEARIGQTVEIFSASQSNTTYFRTVREDGKTNIEAAISLEKINAAE